MLKLIRTQKMVPFLDVSIGQPFYAHQKIWIRTDYAAATVLVGTSIRSEGCIRMANTCNFLIDECDRMVEAIEVQPS